MLFHHPTTNTPQTGATSALTRVGIPGGLSAVLIATLVAGSLGLAASPAAADDDGPEHSIELESVHYNPRGADTRSKLNQEYVTVENDSHKARSLRGWTLRDADGNVYRFGSRKVPADRSVRIHTGHGANTPRDRYWGRGHYVWDNHGDIVTLRNAAGQRVDVCHYRGGARVADC